MEKAYKLQLKREACRKRKESARKDLLMVAYINKKYPLIYKEAEVYYDKLDKNNPSKIDLRKTTEFRALKEVEVLNDRMVLEIPITCQNINEQPQNINEQPQNINEQPQNINEQPQNINEQPQNINEQPQNINEQPLLDDLRDIQGIMADQLQPDVIENIMKELRNDPHVSKLMDEIETELTEGMNLFDDDNIELEIDDRLEEELLW